MNWFKNNIWIYLAIILYGILFLLPYIGSIHLFDWDEIIFAESAREMIVSGDYLTVNSNFIPFWEKPPLFFWIQVISMKIFGINEFASRFPNVICGILTLITIFNIGKRLSGQRFGILWVISFATAILPFFYFKSGIIDPWLNLFVMLGFAYFIFYLDPDNTQRRLLKLILSALFFGLAILTKGPVSILIFGLGFFAYLFFKKIKIRVTFLHVMLFLLVMVSVGGSWYIYQVFSGNIDVMKAFIHYQATLFTVDFAGHSGFPGFHFVILLFGVFPGSVLFMKSLTKKSEDTNLQQMFRTWMYILFFIVLVLFSFVQTKLVHYSSLAYFPITFLAAWVWEKWIGRKIEINGWQLVIISFIALVYASIAIAIPILYSNNHLVPTSVTGNFPAFWEEALKVDLKFTGFEFLIGIFLIAGIIFSIRLIRKREVKGMFVLHIVTLLFVTLMVYIYTPKIEALNQKAAIDFIEEHSNENGYISTLGFKSYATLYYGKRTPDINPDKGEMDEFLTSNHNFPIYIIMKLDNSQKYFDRYPTMEFIYQENGYVFAKIKSEN